MDRELCGDVHPDRLVEPVRSGRTLRIDSKPGSRHAPATKLRERVQEQCAAETSPAKLAADPEDVHPPKSAVHGMGVAHRKAGRLLFRNRQGPQRGSQYLGYEELVSPF